MFSSNQQLIMTCDDEKDLEKIIKFIIDFGGFKNINAYYLDNHVGLVLMKHMEEKDLNNSKYKDLGITIIQKEEVENFEYLMNVIKLTLSSRAYKATFNPTEEEMEELEYFDGSVYDGWMTGAWEEANKFLPKNDYDWKKAFFIRHYRAGYAK